MKDEKLRELTPEELEDVNGGGLKEIVATTTLAAMAMTGNTVSAFDLASAMAEEGTAHVEIAPDQDETAYPGEMTDYIEAVPEEVSFVLGADASDVTDNVLTIDNSVAEDTVLEADASAPMNTVFTDGLNIEYEAVPGEEEIEGNDQTDALSSDPTEAVFALAEDGVAPLDDTTPTTLQSNDKSTLLTDLITNSIATHQNEGIYAALDSTFATLAANAPSLANPETGVIETDGNIIINTTYDALSSNFNATPEQLMGAIGAAAYRANERGELQALGGDVALVSLAANEGNGQSGITTPQARAIADAIMDSFGKVCPFINDFIPIIKDLMGPLWGNPYAMILDRLDDIEKQIQSAEQSLKDHTYNVVQLAEIDNRFSTMLANSRTLLTRIGDIQGNTALSESQKQEKIAQIYNSSEFIALTSSVNAATEAFTSNQSDAMSNRNLFNAAYMRACGEVMFSGEAIDMTQPYLVRQLISYLVAYTALGDVYDAYEAVYGASAITASRAQMNRDLLGTDAAGNKYKSVFDAFIEYFGRSRFIFVNKNGQGRGILVSDTLGITEGKMQQSEIEISREIKSNTSLSEDDVNAIGKYCLSEKGLSPHDFLVNTVGFKVDEAKAQPKVITVKGPIMKEQTIKGISVFVSPEINHGGFDFWVKKAGKTGISFVGMLNTYTQFIFIQKA